METYEIYGLPSKFLCSSSIQGNTSELFIPHPNGYIYVFEDNKIIGSIHIKEKEVMSILIYFSNKGYKVIKYYIIVTKCDKFFIVTRKESAFQILKTFDQVKLFEIFDFKCEGYLQIKIHFLNSLETQIVDLSCFKKSLVPPENSPKPNFTSYLDQKLQFIKIYADKLNEEIFQLKNNFFYNHKPLNEFFLTLAEKSVKISSTWKNPFKFEIVIVDKWHKCFGNLWIFGARIQNIGERVITDLELLLQQKQVKNFTYCFFPLSTLNKWFGFLKSNLVIHPKEEVFLVGSFEMSDVILEPHILIECHLIFSKGEKVLKIDSFVFNASQMISRQKKQFSVEDLLTIISSQIETCIVIETESTEVDLLETILIDKMDFELNKLEKIKFFYCTSNQIGIVLEQNFFCPRSWKLHIYTRNYSQLYLMVNAFYDFLPEKTLISVIEQ